DRIGRLKEELRVAEQAHALEPSVPTFAIYVALAMAHNGQSAAAIRILEAIPADPSLNYARNIRLAHDYATVGRYKDAADTLLLITDGVVSRSSVEAAAQLLRQAPMKVAAPEALPVLEGGLAFVYAYVGALDRVFEYPERDLEINSLPGGILWHPEYAPLRKTERFKAFVRKGGLPPYWREHGWPDLCRPVGSDDFVCD